MKKIIQTITGLVLLVIITGVDIQAQAIRQLQQGAGSSYSTGDFNVCGTSSTKTFRVIYDHCLNGNCISGCGSNPVRFTVKLYRDGVNIESQVFSVPGDWSNTYFYNLDAQPGDYRAHVKVERRYGWCVGWQVVSSGWTNTIAGNDIGAIPNFNINGIGVSSGGSPINVCASNITINAASTTCESRYRIGVQESNRWWHRTYDYEWGRWFSGTAPNGINLQQLSATYSYPPYFTGPSSRQGSPLIGGNLPNGQERYYRVNVCTDEPSWQCKTVLIKVNGNCRTEEPKDTNKYVVLEQEVPDIWPDYITESLEKFPKEKNALSQEKQTESRSSIDENLSLEESFNTAIDCYPNPLEEATTFRYTLEKEGQVRLTIYDMLGKQVGQPVVNEVQSQGEHTRLFDASTLTPGTYLYILETDGNRITKKMVKSK